MYSVTFVQKTENPKKKMKKQKKQTDKQTKEKINTKK